MIAPALLIVALASPPRPPLVEAITRVPDLTVDLRYATENNFVGERLYPPTARCLLLPETVEALARAQALARKEGLGLKIYDCYRPLAVQWKMWRRFPQKGYVADPREGSNHNRGAAVDVTLVTDDGTEVEMPTAYDSFEKAAHHGYKGATAAARRHRELLLRVMEAAGFRKNRMEWWHYELPGSGRYPVRDEPL